MITSTNIGKATCGNKQGWAFSITWDDRPYPNFISALYRTRKEAQAQLRRYLDGNGFDYYGTAE